MASTKSTVSTTISSGDFVKIDGKGIALVKQQVCRDGAVMYIVQVCGCDFDIEIDAKRVQTVTADSDSETKQTTGSSSRFKIVTDQEVNDFNIKQTNNNTLTKTISDLRIFQAFCNEPEIVIVYLSQVYLICYQNGLELFHAAHEVLCCILLKIMFIKCYVYLELYFVCVAFSCLT